MTKRSSTFESVLRLRSRLGPLPGRKTAGAFFAGVCFGVLGSVVLALVLELDFSDRGSATTPHLDGLPSAGPPSSP